MFTKKRAAMNAIRQIVTTTESMPTIALPEELRYRNVEVIVIDLGEADNGLPPHLDTPENRLKIREKAQRSQKLRETMDNIAAQAQANGLTEEILNEILRESND